MRQVGGPDQYTDDRVTCAGVEVRVDSTGAPGWVTDHLPADGDRPVPGGIRPDGSARRRTPGHLIVGGAVDDPAHLVAGKDRGRGVGPALGDGDHRPVVAAYGQHQVGERQVGEQLPFGDEPLQVTGGGVDRVVLCSASRSTSVDIYPRFGVRSALLVDRDDVTGLNHVADRNLHLGEGAGVPRRARGSHLHRFEKHQGVPDLDARCPAVAGDPDGCHDLRDDIFSHER